VCRGTGVFECDGAGDDVTCVITTPGASPPAEICDGLDQDCDGVPDDGAPSETVHVVSGAMNYRIFRFEASRPDASASLPGTLEHRPCSKPDVVPWASATWTEANAACAAIGSGWRLCSEAEWQRACEGPSLLRYPYGNAYDADACNGEDYDLDCGLPDEDEVLPTGTDYSCPTPLMTCQSAAFAGGTTPTIGAIDMSGNLKEWTSTQVSTSPVAYRIRGGAYDSIAPGLTCDFDFVAGASDFFFPNLGFRCCRTGP
jgi:formylglycine-generating enzyme required for sulfatase activity